jgi:hypothetical protein
MKITRRSVIIASACIVLIVLLLLYLGYIKWGALPFAARQALENGEKFELLSLEPTIQRTNTPDSFHGWKILGRTQIPDQTKRAEIVKEFISGVHHTSPFHCFDPRHGIRVRWKGVNHDFVICFHCRQIEWYCGSNEPKWILITGDPESAFDAILKRARIPLAPKDMMATQGLENSKHETDGKSEE